MEKGVRRFFEGHEGSISIIAALGIVVFIGLAALAVDLARLAGVKSELQKAADAGALAGARGLWPANLKASLNREPNCTTALAAANAILVNNRVANANLVAGEFTVQVGRWDYALKQFTPGCTSDVNGVQVTTQKSNVAMLFTKIFGVFSEDLSASATAVMDFTKEVGKGALPIALNKDYTTPGTSVTISANPDTVDNGGWFVEPPDRASATTFRDYIVNDSCPPLKIGDIINLQNGVDGSVLSCLKDELALHPGGWYTFLPVVNSEKFNQTEPIMAFVPFKITEVQDTGADKCIKGVVESLDEMDRALPGGAKYGALAPPKMVN